MLILEELTARQQEIASSPDLTALQERLSARAGPVLEHPPPVPKWKALLTTDGGVCPDDGTRLEFNPWSPAEHRCPRCGKHFTGERHDRAWAHYQHLWLAERAAHLAALAAIAGNESAARGANELLRAYRDYAAYPNRDNVLGPSRLFFSTYLESIWLGNYLAAATLLRECGELSPDSAEIVSAVADEAANLIGEYDEGFSNRQTWHNAALAAAAVWFEDEELAGRVVEGPTGILAHLLQGFGPDGMWYEGDNYHLFALRGQLLAMGWVHQAGVDLLRDARLSARLLAALRAPAAAALPDFTFPARKDSRFGVSLAQPMYLELWEVGLARLAAVEEVPAELWGWLRELYQTPAPPAQTFDSYLHEAGEPPPQRPRTRGDLSWWALMEMAPAVPSDAKPWSPESVLFEGQGFAVLREGGRYAGLECGAYGGGHGHPDRLNLILHADGEYWLPDFGTGSYVARDLFWYRSTLAHNAPRLDGTSQLPGDAACDNFEVAGSWSWVQAHYGDIGRTLVSGPQYLLDVVELSAAEDHLLELPLHLTGEVVVESPGGWVPADLSDEFVQDAESFDFAGTGPLLRTRSRNGTTLNVYLDFDGQLLRARAPGAPGTPGLAPFYLVRVSGRNPRIVILYEAGRLEPVVRGVRCVDKVVEVDTSAGLDRHVATAEGWEVRGPKEIVRLRGTRRETAAFKPLIQRDRPLLTHGVALAVSEVPALDGSMAGFDPREPLELDHEDQYRRSEEPYPGADEFSARAFVNWNDEGLYLAVEVTKPDVFAQDPGAEPLRLDNEPDEIHRDGIQTYLRLPGEDAVHGYLVVPTIQGGSLLARRVSGATVGKDQVQGSWERTEGGYRMTVALHPPDWRSFRPGEEIGFDLLVNQMLPERLRRAGQLVWSGGGGWVWLRGDRQDPSRLGTLELR